MESLWFLPPVAAIGLWVAWSDMKFMKIPNTAVIALALAYLVIGPSPSASTGPPISGASRWV